MALDQDQAASDSRVEQAAADVHVLIEDRSAAKLAVQAANVAIGAVLRRLLDQEFLTLDGVAQLCELEPAEVRRLTRTPTASPPPAPAVSSPVAPPASEAATVTELRPAGRRRWRRAFTARWSARRLPPGRRLDAGQARLPRLYALREGAAEPDPEDEKEPIA